MDEEYYDFLETRIVILNLIHTGDFLFNVSSSGVLIKVNEVLIEWW